MTLLEKAKQEHPELDEEKLVTWMCPCDLGYERLPDGCGQVGPVQEICRECWNRPADAAGGGESQPVCSAAVEKCEEEREPEAFFGNRKAARETPSTAEAVPLPQTRQAAGDGERGGAGDGL